MSSDADSHFFDLLSSTLKRREEMKEHQKSQDDYGDPDSYFHEPRVSISEVLKHSEFTYGEGDFQKLIDAQQKMHKENLVVLLDERQDGICNRMQFISGDAIERAKDIIHDEV